MLAGAMAFPMNFRAFSFNLFSFSDIGFQATFFKLTIGEDIYSMLQNLIYFFNLILLQKYMFFKL